jgi:hypothetical protein
VKHDIINDTISMLVMYMPTLVKYGYTVDSSYCFHQIQPVLSWGRGVEELKTLCSVVCGGQCCGIGDFLCGGSLIPSSVPCGFGSGCVCIAASLGVLVEDCIQCTVLSSLPPIECHYRRGDYKMAKFSSNW